MDPGAGGRGVGAAPRFLSTPPARLLEFPGAYFCRGGMDSMEPPPPPPPIPLDWPPMRERNDINVDQTFAQKVGLFLLGAFPLSSHGTF